MIKRKISDSIARSIILYSYLHHKSIFKFTFNDVYNNLIRYRRRMTYQKHMYPLKYFHNRLDFLKRIQSMGVSAALYTMI